MLIQILLLGILSTTGATYTHGGKSITSRKNDGYGNYAFGYDIEDPLGATNGRYEVGDAHGNKKGGYTISDIDGRVRRVEYVADEHGFRAFVHTNEPGTASSHPASAVISSENQAPIHDLPVSTIKRVVRPVTIDAPLPIGRLRKVVRPVIVDRVSQTVRPVDSGIKGFRPSVDSGTKGFHPVGSGVKGFRPFGSETKGFHPVGSGTKGFHPVGSGTKGFHPVGSGAKGFHGVDFGTEGLHPIGSQGKGFHDPSVGTGRISQTVYDVPIAQVKTVPNPVVVDHISQTVHDVPISHPKKVSHSVVVDHVPQTIHHDHVSVKKTFRPSHISQTVYPSSSIYSAGTHHGSPHTFRAAQVAHAAMYQPNLYNGNYQVKYMQPAPPVVREPYYPDTIHSSPHLEYGLRTYSAPEVDNILSLDSSPHSPRSHPQKLASQVPTTHVKGTPFQQSGLFPHVYGGFIRSERPFRSHIL